jgi:hypothetical protein
MRFHHLVMPIVLVGPLSVGVALAQETSTSKSTTTTTTTVITSAVPAPKEVVVEPKGYISCSTVAAGWHGKTWRSDFKVCKYDTKSPAVEGEAWVAGHWECSQYSMIADKNECTSWDWTAGHWVKTYDEIAGIE